MSFDDALDMYTVSHRDDHDLEIVGAWWPKFLPWATEGDNGIIALFHSEEAALHYRLMLINEKMNKGWNSP